MQRSPTALVLALLCLLASRSLALDLYIAPGGSDSASGAADHPLASPAGARDLLRSLRRQGKLSDDAVNVVVRAGVYRLDQPLVFEAIDSGTEKSPIQFTADKDAMVVFSGGRLITGWQKRDGDLWQAELPEVKAGHWYFRQLFAGEQRLPRSRIPAKGMLETAGPLSKYAPLIKLRDFKGVKALRGEHPDAYCGFNFRPGDFADWPDIADAEVITFHSWECSWQTIRRIDEQTHDVLFNSPCRYPVGVFTPHCPYRIENLREGLTQPGEWQLDRASGELSYLAHPGENPNDLQIIAPAMDNLLVFNGDYKAKKYVEHIAFRGIHFEHANYPMGIYDVAANWPAPMLKVDPNFPKEFAPGYTDAQAAPLCGHAIELTGARDIAFERCEIAHIGAYGVGILLGSSDVHVVGCYIHDAGGGGVAAMYPNRSIEGMNRDDMPHDNVIENNTIRHISLVHPSAVGILVGQAWGNRVRHNEISDVGYAGIHLGWTWGRAANYTADNLIEANDVHDVMRDVVDAAGIYNLGIDHGTVYRGNYVHSVHRVKLAGGPAAGLYFDEGSRDIHCENNLIRDVSKVLNFNQCKRQDMTWTNNYFSAKDEAAAPDEVKKIIDNAGPETQYRHPN
jgi:hypothetical protein